MDTARQFAADARSDGATVWVDSQVLLLTDVWREVEPALRFVIAIRNPLETILSLRHRHGIELNQGFALCLAHLRCPAELIPAEQRIVVHCDACLLDPVTQAARLFAYVGAREAWNVGATCSLRGLQTGSAILSPLGCPLLTSLSHLGRLSSPRAVDLHHALEHDLSYCRH